MVKYKIARLIVSKTSITLYTTAPGLIDWAQKTIKEMFPRSTQRVDNLLIGSSKKGEFLGGQQFKLLLWGFDNSDVQVGYWLVGQLCEQGWEPFTVNDFVPGDLHELVVFYFRQIETAS